MTTSKVRPSTYVAGTAAAVLLAISVTSWATAATGRSQAAASPLATQKYVRQEIKKLTPGITVHRAKSAGTATTAGSAKVATTATTATNSSQLAGATQNEYQRRIMWAFVQPTAKIALQSGGITVVSPSIGNYYVTFPSIVSTSGLIATQHDIGTEAGGPQPTEQITAASCGYNVLSEESSGGQVMCPSPNANTEVKVTITTTDDQTGEERGFYVAVIPNSPIIFK